MHLQLPDIILRDKGKTGFVVGLGPSLRNQLAMLKQIDQDKESFKIISCNNADQVTDLLFDYWMVAKPENLGNTLNIENAHNRYVSRPKALLLYTDCLDLTPRSLVTRLLGNIDYIGYDHRHFKGTPCTAGSGPAGRQICCEHLIAERLCIQEVLQKVTKYDRHYSSGDTVEVHMLALAVIAGMNPIYITGMDLYYTDGYVRNDLPETAEMVGMDMVQNILNDLTLIRDMAKNIGVDIYCLDGGLKISEIFPVKKFPTLKEAMGAIQLFDGDVQVHGMSIDIEFSENQQSVPEPVPNTKPSDEYVTVKNTGEFGDTGSGSGVGGTVQEPGTITQLPQPEFSDSMKSQAEGRANRAKKYIFNGQDLTAAEIIKILNEEEGEKLTDKSPESQPLAEMLVFTEIIGCAEVGKIALETFHKYHDHKVVVFTTTKDRMDLGPVGDHKNNHFYIVSEEIREKFKKGHEGTAEIFALVFNQNFLGLENNISNIVHFDSDVVFKEECLSVMSQLFDEGYDIVGTRRCYVNNPSNIPVKEGIPDTVSTYFYGMKRSVMPLGYIHEDIVKMFLGHNIGLDHEVFDFGDAIVFHALNRGANIYFLDNTMFGGQDEHGKKMTAYKANLHVDAGRYLVHFGGAGSGCVCYHEPAGKNESYGRWAVVRYALFCRIFFNKVIPVDAGETKFDDDGRWVSGNFNGEIMNDVKQAIK